MAIDWSATGTMLTGIGTVGSTIAIVIAAILGRNAASNYGEQKQSEREMDYAERALASAYKLESALDAIRSPFSSGTELQNSEAELSDQEWFKALADPKRKQTIQANVFYQRMRRFDPEFDEAASLLPFVRAYFGEKAEASLAQIIRARQTVRIYADAYAEDNYKDPDYSQEIRSNIWRGFSQKKEDPVRSSIEAAIRELEGILTPIVRKSVRSQRPTIAKQDA